MPTPSAQPQAISLQLRRTFSAPREKVFRAWTDAEAVKQWWAPPGYSAVAIDIDLREGGKYRFTLRKLPEGEAFSNFGTFVELRPPERLVYTWQWDWMDMPETLVTVEFLDRGKETEIVLTHERFPTPELRDDHNKGWNGCFDRVEQYVHS